jgi:hypothetical protein
VVLATPLAAGVTVLGVSAPAQAASGITAPGTATIIKGSTTTVSAQADNVLNAALQVAPPGSNSFETIASGGNLLGTTYLSKAVSIAKNGVYQVRLTGGLTGTTFDSRSFTVRVPPAMPAGLRTNASGRQVVVRWKRGSESDLVGYKVAAAGTTTRTRSTKDMCADTECMTTITFPAGAGGQVPVFVTALRSDGAKGTVGSKAATSTVDLANGPGSGGLTDGGLGLPGTPSDVPLNPLQDNAPIDLPSVTPDGATPGFQYPAPEPEVAAPAESAPAARNAAAATPLQWGKSLGIALILLLLAAHLGTWTRRMRVAEARGETAAAGAGDPGGRDRSKAAAGGSTGTTSAGTAAGSATTEVAAPAVATAWSSADKPSETPAGAVTTETVATAGAPRTEVARPTGGHRGAPKAPGQRATSSGYRGRRRAD